jgi:hypothetical protein
LELNYEDSLPIKKDMHIFCDANGAKRKSNGNNTKIKKLKEKYDVDYINVISLLI